MLDFEQPKIGRGLIKEGVPFEIDRAHHELEHCLELFIEAHQYLAGKLLFIQRYHRLPTNRKEMENFGIARGSIGDMRTLADRLPILFQNMETQFAKIEDDTSERSVALRKKEPQIREIFAHTMRDVARTSVRLIYNWISIIQAAQGYPLGLEDELAALLKLTNHDTSINDVTRQEVETTLNELHTKIKKLQELRTAPIRLPPPPSNDDAPGRGLRSVVIAD